jgi:hypothetical protein
MSQCSVCNSACHCVQRLFELTLSIRFAYRSVCAGDKCRLRPRSHVTVFYRSGDNRTRASTTWTSPVLTGLSNEQERCDQAVVHAQWSAMDRNSIIALFLYRRRKRRRSGLHWVQPIIQKREEFGGFYTLFGELWDDANKFLNYFQMLVSSFDEIHCHLKESLQRRNSKMRNCIRPVEMLAVALR